MSFYHFDSDQPPLRVTSNADYNKQKYERLMQEASRTHYCGEEYRQQLFREAEEFREENDVE